MVSETSNEQLGLKMPRHPRDIGHDIVERDGGWYIVSTVRLLSPSQVDEMTPQIRAMFQPFETMIWACDPVFGEKTGDELWQRRYNTQEDAEDGHSFVLIEWPL